jgi:hypothetical protein
MNLETWLAAIVPVSSLLTLSWRPRDPKGWRLQLFGAADDYHCREVEG